MLFSLLKRCPFAFALSLLCLTGPLLAQTSRPHRPESTTVRLTLNDLSAFQSSSARWRTAADVVVNPDAPNALTALTGTGLLVNRPDAGRVANLLTNFSHGDADIDLDFMVARTTSAGVYLQGRYELLLADSWGVRQARITDAGAVSDRWDESHPAGTQSYGGHPARQNAGRAPGLWQHLHAVFQAPRFDVAGRKTENARLLRLELNGIIVQENVELTGPTHGAAFATEAAIGPLVFRGDQGLVAFRNIRYTPFDKKRPELRDLRYSLYKGKFLKKSEFDVKIPPEADGPLPALTSQVGSLPSTFLIRYTGTLRVSEPGRYEFRMRLGNGRGLLRVNNQPVLTRLEGQETGQIDLPVGDLPVEVLYSKPDDWGVPSLELTASGPGIRAFALAGDMNEEDITDPILVDVATQPLLRSFMDLPGVDSPSEAATDGGRTHRVTHGISVGDAATAVHYTYDLDNGSLVQVWRGAFLDATPMWHDRGDGSARPLGLVQRFGKPALALAVLPTPDAPWPTDTTGSAYRPHGYALDDHDRPTFRYTTFGHRVTDQLQALPNGQGISRVVTVTNPDAALRLRIASGNQIETLPSGLYLIDKTVYVRPEAGTLVLVRNVGNRQELLAPVTTGTVRYAVLF
jgi:Domain of Unknown Function (DUF1080)